MCLPIGSNVGQCRRAARGHQPHIWDHAANGHPTCGVFERAYGRVETKSVGPRCHDQSRNASTPVADRPRSGIRVPGCIYPAPEPAPAPAVRLRDARPRLLIVLCLAPADGPQEEQCQPAVACRSGSRFLWVSWVYSECSTRSGVHSKDHLVAVAYVYSDTLTRIRTPLCWTPLARCWARLVKDRSACSARGCRWSASLRLPTENRRPRPFALTRPCVTTTLQEPTIKELLRWVQGRPDSSPFSRTCEK